jgi:hypothetical protein
MESAKPQKEHEWLQQLVGDWRFEAPSKEPGCSHTGTQTVRSIGGLWIQAEGRSQMPDGQSAVMMLTLGYDPQKGKFVGTWLDTMMAYLWVYEGSLDPTGKILSLDTEGPSFTGNGKMAKYRETIEIKNPDSRVFTSSILGADGKWQTIMTAKYTRVK